jgi:hypothetical protein
LVKTECLLLLRHLKNGDDGDLPEEETLQFRDGPASILFPVRPSAPPAAPPKPKKKPVYDNDIPDTENVPGKSGDSEKVDKQQRQTQSPERSIDKSEKVYHFIILYSLLTNIISSTPYPCFDLRLTVNYILRRERMLQSTNQRR